jgi:glycosyltransferase involved in cell wall biosynthesis
MESTTILHVANFKPNYSSNFIASIRALNRQSHALGIRHSLAFPHEARERKWISMLQDDDIAVHFLPDPASVTQSTRAIVRLVRLENAAIIHTHFSRQYEIEAAAARLLCGRVNLPLVWHRHSAGPTARPLATRLKDVIGNRLLASDATVIAVSDELREAASQSGIAPSHVRVIENGIDIGRVTRVLTPGAEMRKAWQIGEKVFTFLHFGWDPVTKGVDLVLQACKQICRQQPSFALVIVGLKDADIRGAVGSAMPPWLRVVAPIESVGDLYAAADCMLSSSRWEGFSYAVAEAMAAGLPVITTDVRGLRWAAASSGVVLVPLEPSALASAMVAMIHSTQRPAYARANRQLISQSYSVDGWASRVIRIYTELVGIVTKRRPAACP